MRLRSSGGWASHLACVGLGALLTAAVWAGVRLAGEGMLRRSDSSAGVRAFYESRVRDFAEPRMRIGESSPLQSITGPEACEVVPAAVFEAVGFYFVNVREQDNGQVFVFQANAGSVFTYGVLATTDGSSSHLEVYARDGTFLAAGIPDWKAGTITWQRRDQVRRHAAMWG